MGWIQFYTHECDLPHLLESGRGVAQTFDGITHYSGPPGIGSVWKCDDCGTEWLVTCGDEGWSLGPHPVKFWKLHALGAVGKMHVLQESHA